MNRAESIHRLRKLFKLPPLLCTLALGACATQYQPHSFTGGYTDYLTGPDTAIVTFDANGYTPVTTAMDMTALRCCEVTLSHGFRYFKELNTADLSVNTSATIPGFATTTSYANAYGFGNFATAQGNSFTTIQPPQTIGFHKPVFRVTIQMLQKPVPGALDAAFLQSNLKQHLGIKK
jgi:hypothetical protein